MKDHCLTCARLTESRFTAQPHGGVWHCVECGNIVDQDYDFPVPPGDDDGEPVGSCENCGVNIYPNEDDGSGLCDQCQWWPALRSNDQ